MSLEIKKPTAEKYHIEKPEEAKEETEIKNPEILALLEPMQELLKKLKTRIDNKEYKLIIGDDASGRIPALIFSKVLRALYEEESRNLQTIFIAGSSRGFRMMEHAERQKEKTVKISEYLKKYAISDKKMEENNKLQRVLIVTDAVSTGGTLKPLVDALQENQLDADIATIDLVTDRDLIHERKENLKELSGKIFTGRVIPSFYSDPYSLLGKKHLSGVKKNPSELFSEKVPNVQGKIQEARKDAAILSETLVGWYKYLLPKEELMKNEAESSK